MINHAEARRLKFLLGGSHSLLLLTSVTLLPLSVPRANADVPDTVSHQEVVNFDRRNKEAHNLLSQCDYAKSEALFRVLVKDATRLFGPEHPKTLTQRHELAAAFLEEHYYPEAEAEFRAVWSLRSRVLGPKDPDTLLSHFQLAVTLCSQHRHAEAETEYRSALADEERILGPDHPQTLQTDFRLAQCLQMQGRLGEARTFAARAYEGGRQRFGEDSFEVTIYRLLWNQLRN